MSLPQPIRELIERQREAYRSQLCKERQHRREFLDPFFKALGRDTTATETQVDRISYELHGLTVEEIKITEVAA